MAKYGINPEDRPGSYGNDPENVIDVDDVENVDAEYEWEVTVVSSYGDVIASTTVVAAENTALQRAVAELFGVSEEEARTGDIFDYTNSRGEESSFAMMDVSHPSPRKITLFVHDESEEQDAIDAVVEAGFDFGSESARDVVGDFLLERGYPIGLVRDVQDRLIGLAGNDDYMPMNHHRIRVTTPDGIPHDGIVITAPEVILGPGEGWTRGAVEIRLLDGTDLSRFDADNILYLINDGGMLSGEIDVTEDEDAEEEEVLAWEILNQDRYRGDIEN